MIPTTNLDLFAGISVADFAAAFLVGVARSGDRPQRGSLRNEEHLAPAGRFEDDLHRLGMQDKRRKSPSIYQLLVEAGL